MRKDIRDAVEQTHKTYDRIARDYSIKIDKLVSNSWIGEYERSLIDRLLSMIKSLKPQILDIGCGNGKDTRYLMQQSIMAIGIDISSGMLEEARKCVPDSILYQMDMRNLGFTSESFHGVWANGCIYHVPKSDFIRVLGEVRRILKSSGIFSFNFKVGSGELLEESPRSYGGSPRFYSYYTATEMERLLNQNGFVVIEKQQYPERIFDEEIAHFWVKRPDSL